MHNNNNNKNDNIWRTKMRETGADRSPSWKEFRAATGTTAPEECERRARKPRRNYFSSYSLIMMINITIIKYSHGNARGRFYPSSDLTSKSKPSDAAMYTCMYIIL